MTFKKWRIVGKKSSPTLEISKQAQCKNSGDRTGDPKKFFSALFPFTSTFLDTSDKQYTHAVFRFGSPAKSAKSGSLAARFFTQNFSEFSRLFY